jgi:serine/threonine-protein kinase
MQPGDKVGGYQLVEKLGEGGMAEVWKARSVVLDRVVAIKFLLQRFTQDPDLQQRFLQEGRIQARLQHPHIVSVLHADAENGRSYLVTDYVGGKSLEALIQQYGGRPLPVPQVISISSDVLSALDYAHNLPQGAIVHRDVKPPTSCWRPMGAPGWPTSASLWPSTRTARRAPVLSWGPSFI